MVQSGAPATIEAALKRERNTFAMKVRMARSILAWSQTDLAKRVGMTQRAIHRIEQGHHDPMRSTVVAIERAWGAEGIDFRADPKGGFAVNFLKHFVWDRTKKKK